MTKKNIFTAAQTVEKETWVYYANDNGFQKFIKNNLEHQLAERIYQECQTGEKIVTVGEPYTHEILPLNQIEMRADVRVEELVRCKDCRYFHKNVWGSDIGIGRPYDNLIVGHCGCEFWGRKEDRDMTQTAEDAFCSFGERREK